MVASRHRLNFFSLEGNDRLRHRVLSGFAGEPLNLVRGRLRRSRVTASGGGHRLQLPLDRTKIARRGHERPIDEVWV